MSTGARVWRAARTHMSISMWLDDDGDDGTDETHAGRECTAEERSPHGTHPCCRLHTMEPSGRASRADGQLGGPRWCGASFGGGGGR
jgi:hypothetical protein